MFLRDFFSDVCFVIANLENEGLGTSLEAKIAFGTPLSDMATIAIGCRLIIFIETHNPEGKRASCLFDKFCCLEQHGADLVDPETSSLRHGDGLTMCATWGPGRRGGVPGLRGLQGPYQNCPWRGLFLVETGELQHFSLLNLRGSLEDTAMGFAC